MLIANGIEMLELSATGMGKTDTIYPTLIWDETTVVLVDTGYPGQLEKIREAVEKAGLPFGRLNKIILTHQDLDHIGSLPALIGELSPGLEVISREIEKPYIQGERRLIKITSEAIEQAMAAIPAHVPDEWRRAFKATLENPPKGKVDTTAADGDVLPYCGGIVVIGTPGHTPGHFSLYHVPSRTLIAGDALIAVDGKLQLANPHVTWDMDAAARSLTKLTAFDIRHVICYHGGLVQGDIRFPIPDRA